MIKDFPIPVLYEDDDILAVDKPEGIAVIPERDLDKETILSILTAKRGDKLYVVHRLDKEVSGVLLFAKNAEAHKNVSMQFEHREVEKMYTAVVHGIIIEDQGTVDLPLRQFGSGRMGVDKEKGKPSITTFNVLQRLDKYTLIQASPHTGRRHQIRVHLYCMGNPIVGDLRYGEKALQSEFPRLMLHSTRITLKNINGVAITIESPLPPIFEHFVSGMSK